MSGSALLEYIRLMRDRRADSAKNSGYTKWALAVATVLLARELLALIPEVSAVQNGWTLVERLFLSAHVVVLMLWIGLDPHDHPARHSKSEYRIDTEPGFRSLPRQFVLLGLLIGLPIGAALHLYLTTDFSEDFRSLLVATFGLLGIVAVVGVVKSFTREAHLLRCGFPPASDLEPQNRSAGPRIFGLLLALAFITGHVFGIIETCRSIPTEAIYATVACAGVLTLLAYLVFYLVRGMTSSRITRRLELIEREIVLNGMSDDMARDRLEEEILGESVGRWLNKKLDASRACAGAIETFEQALPKAIQDIQSLAQDLHHERRGRTSDLKANVEKFASQWKNLHDPLNEWLSKALESATKAQDFVLGGLLREAQNSLELLDQETRKRLQRVQSTVRGL